MLTYRNLIHAFADLDITPESHILLHAGPGAAQTTSGGAKTLVGALLASCASLMTPAFTRRTMIVPLQGPPQNGVKYGADDERNFEAEFFDPQMPADAELGEVAEAVRLHPEAARSMHPILSFSGVRCPDGLKAQSLREPLAPIGWLAEVDADVLFLNADHSADVSLHWAERQAGRITFTRWALTGRGVVVCPNMPGCARGFRDFDRRLQGVRILGRAGDLTLERVPLRDLLHIAAGWMREDPLALLCKHEDCLECKVVRSAVRASSAQA